MEYYQIMKRAYMVVENIHPRGELYYDDMGPMGVEYYSYYSDPSPTTPRP